MGSPSCALPSQSPARASRLFADSCISVDWWGGSELTHGPVPRLVTGAQGPALSGNICTWAAGQRRDATQGFPVPSSLQINPPHRGGAPHRGITRTPPSLQGGDTTQTTLLRVILGVSFPRRNEKYRPTRNWTGESERTIC